MLAGSCLLLPSTVCKLQGSSSHRELTRMSEEEFLVGCWEEHRIFSFLLLSLISQSARHQFTDLITPVQLLWENVRVLSVPCHEKQLLNVRNYLLFSLAVYRLLRKMEWFPTEIWFFSIPSCFHWQFSEMTFQQHILSYGREILSGCVEGQSCRYSYFLTGE